MVVVVPAGLSVLLVLPLLLLLPLVFLPLLRLTPLLVVVVGVAGADDRQRSVRVATGTLNDQVAIPVAGATLVDRVVVATTADLVPAIVDTIVVIVAIHIVRPAKNDVADAVGALRVVAVSAVAIILDRVRADDPVVAIT